MTIKLNRFLWLGAAVALLQSGALYAMVEQHASVLRNGSDITLVPKQPVDPHDLLRGDYVYLSYAISNIEAGKVTGTQPASTKDADIYVTMKQGDDGAWTFASASWQKREELQAGEIQLHGHTSRFNASPTSEIRVDYGIERYYVPEGHGLAIEAQQREHRIEAVIAVSPGGEARIRALKEDGRVLYEEPIY
jgi:uncharacterized membrane-anchored protein